jgi:hypothetical protein
VTYFIAGKSSRQFDFQYAHRYSGNQSNSDRQLDFGLTLSSFIQWADKHKLIIRRVKRPSSTPIWPTRRDVERGKVMFTSHKLRSAIRRFP